MSRLVATLAMLSTLAARAEAGPVEFVAGEEHVLIRIKGATATQQATARGDLIEIPVDGATAAQRLTLNDETVKRIELLPGRLLVALHHSRKSTERTAAQTRFVAAGGVLTIELPRHPSAHPFASAPLTVPTTPATPTAIAAPPAAPTATLNAPMQPAPVATAPAAPISSSAAAAPATPAPLGTSPPLPGLPSPPPLVGSEPPPAPYGRLGIFFIVLGSVAAIAILRRKGRRDSLSRDAIRVIASHSLGNKAKLVLVEAQGRELFLAVHENRTDLLSGWPLDDAAPTSESSASQPHRSEAITLPTTTEPARSTPIAASPAVAGLLKLRRQSEDAPAAADQVDELSTRPTLNNASELFGQRLRDALKRRGVA